MSWQFSHTLFWLNSLIFGTSGPIQSGDLSSGVFEDGGLFSFILGSIGIVLFKFAVFSFGSVLLLFTIGVGELTVELFAGSSGGLLPGIFLLGSIC